MVAAAALKATALKTSKAKKAPAAHPPFAKMIVEAIASLKEKGGSSRQAILKYIKSHYKVEEKIAEVNVRRVLVSATAAGKLVRVKGAGASGSFKVSQKVEKKPRAVTKKPKKTPSKPKTASATKTEKAKKTPSKPKKAASAAKSKKVVVKKSKKPAVKKTPRKAPAAKK